MDSILIDNNKYLADDCMRSFTTPLFIPSIFFSVIGVCLAVGFYEKFNRKEYFLPYLYFGNTALLYGLSHIFLIIFIVEERENDIQIDQEEIDFSHTFALSYALFVEPIGSFFIHLACFRLLETWIRSGQKQQRLLSRYGVTGLCILFSFIPVLFSILGNTILINQSNRPESSMSEIKKALILKLLTAVFQLLLSMVYSVLCLAFVWSAVRHHSIERAIWENDEGRELKSVEPVERTFWKAVSLMLSIGVLCLMRFAYGLYLSITLLVTGPVWNVPPYILFVVTDGVVLLFIGYLFDLTTVKELIVYTHVKPALLNQFSNHLACNKNPKEIIPFSRSPMILENEY